MKRGTIYLPTTEDSVWVRLLFRIKAEDRELTWIQARRRAIKYRLRGRMARVVTDDRGGYLVATYNPRTRAPRRCDLLV